MVWMPRIAAALLALLIALAAVVVAWWQKVMPVTEGRLEVAGLVGEVAIERDAAGIPTLRGASRDAVLYGLGFVHAQDRLWQLETHRRIGAGRLAEAFGPGAVDNDRFLRALGVRRAASAQWKQLDADARAAVSAYTAGINAFIGDHLWARPPEFLILGLDPEPWTPEDTLAWGIMMAWDLGGNWNNELLRMRLAMSLPVARIDQLLPPYPGEKPLPVRDYAALYRDLKLSGELGRQALLDAPESGIDGVGSNNWVLAGSHTVSGKPLLANDPHLKLTAPALWYFARLEAPGFKVAGATMPGLPVVVLGQNERIAWGFTNTNPDVQDVYLEQIKPDDATRYRTPEGWAAFQSFSETIRVKGQAGVSLTTRATRHGPVITDAGTAVVAGLTGSAAAPAYALALRWTALDADASSIAAGLAINRAGSVAEFVHAAEDHQAPMQNMVVADVGGAIGMVAAGRVPLRRADNDLRGLVPAPGWDSRYDWAGFLDPGLTPREINPPRGWIATANHRITSADYPHFITSEWAAPYRQQRIEALLGRKARHDKESLRQIQIDVMSLAAQRLLPYLRQAKPTHALGAAALQMLATFDGEMRATDAAPLIFAAWAREMTRAVFADEMGGDDAYLRQVGRSDFRAGLEGVLLRNDAWWCDDKATPATETCAALIGRSLDRALDELQRRQGAEIARWQWGAEHQSRSEHRPFSKVKALAPWFEIRVATAGDNYTVNVARYHLKGDEPYLNEHAASLRAIYDLNDAANSSVMHSSGQSGLFLTPDYRRFVEPWQAVRDLPLWGSGERKLVLQGRSAAK
ncbi:MAG: penicillin amidase [Rhodocyclales bacterium RIFCSPLOWO2_02_FULL_63_24]|nr:MAG: penicillin amidase [Rhodocyclales bacterium RIFCSPLOWO2_02_FULL_63_24]